MDTMWRTFSAEEIQRQYSPSVWNKRLPPEKVVDVTIDVLTTESDRVFSTVPCERDVPYGNTERQKLDIFGDALQPTDAPVIMYIHGGYWQALSRQQSAFLVCPLVASGAVVITIGYDLAPQANMDQIVSQAQAALRYVLKYAQQRGSKGVYVCGHSAGGHLTMMTMATDWKKFSDIDPSLVKGLIPVSGVFDVRPIVQTFANEPLGMTEEDAWRNSPANCLSVICANCRDVKVKVVVGEHDSPEFRRQSREYCKALSTGGVNSSFMELPERDHFDVVELLASPGYVLTQEIVAFINQ